MRTCTHISRRLATACVRLFVILSVGVSTLVAQNPNLGTAGAKFLSIPVGARMAAMGGAAVGTVTDASAAFWNPAGLARVTSNEAFFAYTSWWATIGLSHAAFVHTDENLGTFGVSLTSLTMDKMEVTTEAEPEGTGQFFDARDLMIGLSYARRLTQDFSVGVTAKYVSQRIWNETAGGVAFDVGTQYRVGWGDLTLAMSMTNFGPDMKFDGRDLSVKYDANTNLPSNRLAPASLATDDYALPLYFQVGLGMTVLTMEDFSVLVGVDAAHPNDNDERINVGTEIGVLHQVFFRGGYRFGYDQETWSLGAGVNVPLGDTHLRFDYAYSHYTILPNIHRISLGVDL